MLDIRKSQTQILSKRFVTIKYSQLIIRDLERLENVNKMSVKTSYLLNSYIMNLAAAWQTFIEDLLKECVEEICADSDEKIKAILILNFNEKIKKFNNPGTENIDNIFESLIGIRKITMQLDNHVQARNKINEIMLIRHRIAHKGFSKKILSIEENFEFMEFILQVAGQLEKICKDYIKI